MQRKFLKISSTNILKSLRDKFGIYNVEYLCDFYKYIFVDTDSYFADLCPVYKHTICIYYLSQLVFHEICELMSVAVSNG
jgi:hypothetical protein